MMTLNEYIKFVWNSVPEAESITFEVYVNADGLIDATGSKLTFTLTKKEKQDV